MVYILLLSIIICIVGSALWSPGAIILLDYVLTPYATVSWTDPLIFPFLNSLSSFFGPVLISKVFFVSILLSGAYLGILLARWIVIRFDYQRYQRQLEVFGGIFFLINPYLYERMMVQPTIALGSLLLGYVLYFLFFAHRSMLAGVFAGLAFIVMPHASYMLALIFGLYLIGFVRSWRRFGEVILGGIIAILMNLNWILAPFFGQTNSVSTISSFSGANLEAFRTQALAPLDVWSTNLLLYGFWGERYSNHYVNVGFLSSLWYIAGFIFLSLVILGWLRFLKKEKKMAQILGIIGIVSLIFAIGIASPITAGFTTWMIEYIPLWQGYREPQKWIGLLMVTEGTGFLIGLGYILHRWGRDRVIQVSILLSVTLVFLIWTPGPLLGYHGQLRTTVYPPAFESFRTELMPSFSGRILALPWHSYIGCDWIGRSVVANPIAGLLTPLRVVSSDNIEVGGILYTNSQTAQTQDIESFLKNGDTALLQKYGFTHIFLMKNCASSSVMESLLDAGVASDSLNLIKSEPTYGFYQIQ